MTSTTTLIGDEGEWLGKQQCIGDWRTFAPRTNHLSVSIGVGKLLVQGGVSDKSSNDKCVYIIEEKVHGSLSSTSTSDQNLPAVWNVTTVQPLNSFESPPRLWSHSCVFYAQDNCVYVFGGRNSLRCFNETYQLNLDTFQWFKVVNVQRLTKDNDTKSNNTLKFRIPCKRANHSSVVINHEMIVFGGLNDYSMQKSRILNDTWALDLHTHTWREVVVNHSQSVPCERHSHGAVTLEDGQSMLIWGGVSKSNQKLTDFWIFNRKSNLWRQIVLTGAVPPHRVDFSMVSISSGLVVIFGGYSNMRYMKDLYVIDLIKRRSIQVDGNFLSRKSLPSSRKSFSMSHISNYNGDKIVIMGGQSRKRGKLDDLWTIDVTKLKKFLIMDFDDNYEVSHSQLTDKYSTTCQELDRSTTGTKETNRNSSVSNGSITVQQQQQSPEDGSNNCIVTVMEIDVERIETLWMKKLKYEVELRDFTSALFTVTNCVLNGAGIDLIEDVALTYFQNGEFANAIDALSHAKNRVKELSVDGYLMLVQAYSAIGRHKDASDALKELIDQRGKRMKPNELTELTSWQNTFPSTGTSFASRFMRIASVGTRMSDVDTMFGYTDALDDAFFEAETAFLDDTDIELKDQEDAQTEKHHSEFQGKTFDIVLAGGSKSGVTTLAQQLRVMFSQSISPGECLCYSKFIQKQAIKIVLSLLKFANEYTNEVESRKTSTEEELSADDDNYAITYSPDVSRLVHLLLIKYDANEAILEEDYANVVQVTSDPAFKQVYKCRHIIYGRLNLAERGRMSREAVGVVMEYNVEYFVNNIARILSSNYRATPFDVLYLSEKVNFQVPSFIQKIGKHLEHNHHHDITIDERSVVRVKDDDSYEEQMDLIKMEFMYRRVPYKLINITDRINAESGTAGYIASKFHNINSVIIMASLGDVYKKVNPQLKPKEEAHEEIYPGVIVNTNSNSSIVTAMHTFYHLANASEFSDRPVLLLFTHVDTYAKLREVNIDLSQVFPHFTAADSKDKHIKYLEKVFLDLNNLGPKNRRIHLRFIDSTDRVQVANTFKFVDSLTNAVRAHALLKELKML